MHVAASYGKKAVVQLLLDGGAELNVTDQYGRTPLREATDAGYIHSISIDVVQIMLERRADPNMADQYGTTPLMIAQFRAQGYNYYKDIAKILKEYGGV